MKIKNIDKFFLLYWRAWILSWKASFTSDIPKLVEIGKKLSDIEDQMEKL